MFPVLVPVEVVQGVHTQVVQGVHTRVDGSRVLDISVVVQHKNYSFSPYLTTYITFMKNIY